MATKKKTKRSSPKSRAPSKAPTRSKPSKVRELVQKLNKHRTKSSVTLEQAIERQNDLQESMIGLVEKLHAAALKHIEPGLDALGRIANLLPDINLRLCLIEKLMWPRALLILRDDQGARCHRVNMPPDSKGLSQAFTFRARHAGPQVLDLEQLGAIPLIMLTVTVGGQLVVDGGALQAHIKVPIEGIDITAVVSVLDLGAGDCSTPPRSALR